MALPVLFIDLGTGRGGASVSMLNSITYFDKNKIKPFVLIKPENRLKEQYDAAGIETFFLTDAPSFRPSERNNFYSYLLWLLGSGRKRRFYNRVSQIVSERNISLVHSNHENLALVLNKLAPRLDVPWTCHLRATLPAGFWADMVYDAVHSSALAAVSISEEVNAAFTMRSRKHNAPSHVIYNSAPSMQDVAPDPELVSESGVFKVVAISHLDQTRGTDRIVDVAASLARQGVQDIRFFIYGTASAKPGVKCNDYVEWLKIRARERGADKLIVFKGYTENAATVLKAADVLIRLRRRSDPWGRDIIEAMCAGTPVVTVGRYNTFVAHGVTGFLFETYDPDSIAQALLEMRDAEALRKAMSDAAKLKAIKLFNPVTQSSALADTLIQAVETSV